MDAANKYANDPVKYTEDKANCITNIMKKAKAYYTMNLSEASKQPHTK